MTNLWTCDKVKGDLQHDYTAEHIWTQVAKRIANVRFTKASVIFFDIFWQKVGEDMTRVWVIGVGGMGFTHVKALKSLAEEMDLQVVAIADLQEKYQKRAKEEWPEATI